MKKRIGWMGLLMSSLETKSFGWKLWALLGWLCLSVEAWGQAAMKDLFPVPTLERPESVDEWLPMHLPSSVACPEPLQGLSRADYPSFEPGAQSVFPGFQPQLNVSHPLVLPYFTNPSPLFRGDYSTSGVLFPFRYGALVGAGSQTTLPGIGRLNEASLGLVHSLGDRWTLQLGLQARKFSFPYAVGQHFATSGMLQYQAADRLAFRVFGSYTAGPSFGYSTRSYGGSMLLQLSDRFSLEAGVQRQYNPLRGGWETVPMLVPTYKFNKFELGLDVGGLLYQLLHEVVIDNDRMRMGNPTIGPPTTFPR